MRAPDAGAMPLCAEIAHALLRVPAEELGGVGHLAARIRQRLAVLDGDQLRQPLGVAHDQLERLAQDLAALARLLRGPGGERGLRGVERRLGVVDAGAGDRGDLAARSPDRSRRSARRRRISSTCRRSRDRSARWREDCRMRPWLSFNSLTLIPAKRIRLDPGPASRGRAGFTIQRAHRSTMRSTVGRMASSRMSAAGSGMCGVVMRTGGPSRS